ncbi:hypothetical protein FJZ31_21370 [Candidatus Poribacteria bacterium]|nr:hypothetical protein [Candidatus Poribacteria bacterium]
MRIKIVRDVVTIFPINYLAVEDVCFNHYQKRWGKFFSTVEIGKTMLYGEIAKYGEVIRYKGWQTAASRNYYGILKSSDKDALIPSSHANDAVAMLCLALGSNVNNSSFFFVWRRLEFSKRSLHHQNFQKGGIRPTFGCTTNGTFFRKGDYVEASQGKKAFRGWVCGLPTEKTTKVAVCDAYGKRLGQCSVSNVKLLRRSTGVSWQFFSA